MLLRLKEKKSNLPVSASGRNNQSRDTVQLPCSEKLRSGLGFLQTLAGDAAWTVVSFGSVGKQPSLPPCGNSVTQQSSFKICCLLCPPLLCFAVTVSNHSTLFTFPQIIIRAPPPSKNKRKTKCFP